jgi:hypothetical protein
MMDGTPEPITMAMIEQMIWHDRKPPLPLTLEQRTENRLKGVRRRYERKAYFGDNVPNIDAAVAVYKRTLKETTDQYGKRYTFHCERCDACFGAIDGAGSVLHHLHYPGYGYETEHDLKLLCDKCHRRTFV